MSQAKPRVPAVVLLLAAVIFALGTSEFMIAGLLEEMAAELHVSLGQTGLLVTGFAVGMIFGAPVLAVLTLKLPVRTTMLAAILTFAAAHVMGALAPGYGTLMASRVIAAIACGGFWAVAAVHTVRVAPPAVTARSLAALVGGLTVANLIGVPAGALLGHVFGWRSAFWALAVVTALAAVLVAFTVKSLPRKEDLPPLKSLVRLELRVFRYPRIWLALSITALFQGSVFAAFSYFGPLLTHTAGLDPVWVPAVLAAFGVGALVGVTVGGRLADRGLFANMIGSLVALAAAFILLALVARWWLPAVLAIVLIGLSGFSIAGALNARVFQVAGGAPTLAASVNTSAFNVGNAAGPALGAAALTLGLPVVTTVWIGAVLAVLALVLALVARGTDSRWAAKEEGPGAKTGTGTGTGPDRVAADRGGL